MNTQHNIGNRTPASMYLYSKELVKTFIVLNQSIKAIAYVDYMCACISELENTVSEIRMNEYNRIYKD